MRVRKGPDANAAQPRTITIIPNRTPTTITSTSKIIVIRMSTTFIINTMTPTA
jgi:hypothetical protein